MMKKCLCLLMTMMLLMVGLNGFAEEPAENIPGTFDYSVFEDKENFETDKFDKTWGLSATADGEEGNIVLALAMQGNFDGTLRMVALILADGDQNTPETVQILIGETVYSFDLTKLSEEVGLSCIALTEEKADFFAVCANAEEISVRATFNGKTKEDTFSGDSFHGVQDMIKELIRQDAVACYGSEGSEAVQLIERNHLQDMEIR